MRLCACRVICCALLYLIHRGTPPGYLVPSTRYTASVINQHGILSLRGVITRGGDGAQRVFAATFQAVGGVVLIMRLYLGGGVVYNVPRVTNRVVV